MLSKFLTLTVVLFCSLMYSVTTGKPPFVEISRRVDPAEVILVMTWFPGRCVQVMNRIDNGVPCKIEALRPFWTIKEVRGSLSNCEMSGNERVPSDLKERLKEMWPSFYNLPTEYEKFWMSEFKKDGSCFRRQNHPLLGSVWKFFSGALYLALRSDVSAALATDGIVPSVRTFYTKNMTLALQQHHKARVRLLCEIKRDFLMDVEYCFDNFLKPKDCPRSPLLESCAEFVFYPPPPSLPRDVDKPLNRYPNKKRIKFDF